MDLREYTRGMVKLAKGMPWVSSAYRAGEKALDALTWLVTSKAHVSPKSLKGVAKEVLSKGGKKLSLEETLLQGATQVNAATIGTDGVLRPSGSDLSSAAESIVVEVPADFQSIKAADLSSAIDWRTHTRELLCHYFEAGYTAVEFMSEFVDGHRHSYYALRRNFVIS